MRNMIGKRLFLTFVIFSAILLPTFAGGSKEQSSQAAATQAGVQNPAVSVLVNESPWLNAFRKIASIYQNQTGNKVNIIGTPYLGLLSKSINATTAQSSEYEIITLDEVWANQFYSGGLVSSFSSIDPSFKLDPQVIEYGDITRWDQATQTNGKNGKIYGLPINGNIQILYYRKDIFKEKGLQPPQTWSELENDAAKLNDPPKMYGFVGRASGRPDFSYQAVLHSMGGYILKYEPSTKEWKVGLDTPIANKALNLWLDLIRKNSPADYANLGQAQMISLMQSGRVAMQYNVAAAAPNFDNPNQSSVQGKVGATVVPGPSPNTSAPTSGIEVLSIPHNLSAAKKNAALDFIKWLMTKKAQLDFGNAGGIVTRQDVWERLAKNPKFWWAEAVAKSTPYVHGQIRVKSGGQIFQAIDRVLAQAVVNDITPSKALSVAAKEVASIMKKDGYTVSQAQ